MRRIDLEFGELALLRAEPLEGCYDIWLSNPIECKIGDKIRMGIDHEYTLFEAYVVAWECGSDFIIYAQNLSQEEYEEMMMEQNKSN
jgi:hypothetical protein